MVGGKKNAQNIVYKYLKLSKNAQNIVYKEQQKNILNNSKYTNYTPRKLLKICVYIFVRKQEIK